MKLRTSILAVAFSFIAATAASAADMAVKARPVVAPVPVWNWTGFYFGGNIGYGWGGQGASGLDGVTGGLQIGYNWQSGNLLFGVEADIQASDQKDSDASGAFTADARLPWWGTARGRLGYVTGPWLLYATGGLSWQRYELTLSGPGGTVSDHDTKIGYALGAGVEWMFMPRWSAKLEYLFLDTGSTSLTLFGTTVEGKGQSHIARIGVNYHF